MSHRSNREIEQHYFEQFRAHFSLPIGDIEYGDKPDVVIHGKRELGIEIANLYLTNGADPSSEQVQRKRRELVLGKAQALHSSSGGKKIELTVSFDAAHPIDDVQIVASGLATIAHSIEHLAAGLLARQHFAHLQQLQLIYHNPTEYPDALWRASQVFTVTDLSIDRVAELVAAKEQQLANYRRCDSYWLLLIVDFIDTAQDQEITWPDDCVALMTTYERVLIYKPQLALWTEVPVAKPEASGMG
jgi:hypothetical protein